MRGQIIALKNNPNSQGFRPNWLDDASSQNYKHIEIRLEDGNIFTTKKKFPIRELKQGDYVNIFKNKKNKIKKIERIQ